MKTIGLIGGMSWESTLEYYRIINQEMSKRLGGLHSAKILMYSVDFGEVEPLMQAGNWEKIGDHVVGIAKRLENGGADCILLCTNTVHKVADKIEQAVSVPFMHIADAAGEGIVSRNLRKVGLLGTRYTMEEDFYKSRLSKRFGLSILIPSEGDRGLVNDVIFSELCQGVIRQSSGDRFKAIIAELASQGAEGIVLGCTEIPLLIKQEDSAIPLFDTTLMHALCAVDFALS